MTTKTTSKKTTTKKTSTKKPTTKKPAAKKSPRQTALGSVMKKVAVEDAAKAKARAATTTDEVSPAKAPTTPAAAKGGKKAKAGPKAPAKAARPNDAPKPKKEGAPKPPKKPSGLDLAAKVLAEAGEPLAAKAIAERAIAAGWKTNGATPHATLYAAMIREIASKGEASRFRKTDRGLFAAGKVA